MYFPPEFGGLESYVYDLSRGLARAGHDVTVLTSHSVRDSPATEIVDGVRVIRTWFGGKHPAGWMAHTLASTPTYLRLARDAEIFHAQTFASAPPGIIARQLYGKPLVLTLHTSHFQRRVRQRRWRPLLRRIIASADRVLTASRQILDLALELHPHARAESVTNAVDTEMFRPVAPLLEPAGPRRRILAPCRLFDMKGVHHLIDAIPLVQKHVDIELVIVGEGPERANLVAQSRARGVDDVVRFLGSRPHEEMPGLFSSAEVVVLPSLMEATSIAALEAMSCERPVAASRVGGLPELVDEDVGTLFEPADPANLAERLVALLQRPDLAATGAAARRRVVERWSVERLVRRHEEIYNELLTESA